MAIDQQTIEKLTKAIDKLVAKLDAMGSQVDQQEAGDAMREINVQQEELNTRLEEERFLLEAALEERRKAIEENRVLNVLQQQEIENQERIVAELENQQERLGIIEGISKEIGEIAKQTTDAIKGSVTQYSEFNAKAFTAFGLMGSIRDNARQVDDIISNLNKQGLSGVVDSFADAQMEFATFGMGMGEAATALTGLAESSTTFRFATKETRGEILQTAAGFGALGVSGQDFGKLQETLTRNFGQNTQQVASFADSLAGLSETTGKSVATLVNDFNAAGDAILQFGDRATQVFMDTQKIATKFGVEVGNVLGVFDKFDTVESAAETVGQLNAQFGTNLDQLQLLRAETPEERFNILRESLEATGRSFSELGRFEQKAMAQILGQDVGVLQRLMGDPVVLSEGQKGLQELAKTGMNIGKRIGAIFEKITTALAKAGVFDKINAALKSAFGEGGPVENFVDNYIPVLVSFGGVFADTFSTVAKVASVIAPIFSFIGSVIMDTILLPFKGVLNVVNGIVEMFTGDFLGGLKKAAIGVGQLILSFFPIGKIFGKLAQFFPNLARSAGQFFSNVGRNITEFFGSLVTRITNFVGSTVSGVFRSIFDFVKSIFNAIPGLGFIGRKIASFFGSKGTAAAGSATGLTGAMDSVAASTPAPEQALATGGIIKPGTSAIVGDPLTAGVPNIERVTVTPQGAMVQPMPNSGGGGGAQKANIVINIDGKKMGETIVDLIDGQYNAALGG